MLGRTRTGIYIRMQAFPRPTHVAPAGGSPTPGLRVSRDERWALLGGAGRTVWLTGLPGAGKTTIASALERRLLAAGRWACVLDGDLLRAGLTSDLDFSRAARRENVRRVAEVAATMADSGAVVIVALVSPYDDDREAARTIHDHAGLAFSLVHVDAPARLCAERDPKGLYARAARGEVRGLTGRDAPYEPPEAPDLRLRTDREPIDRVVDRVEAFLQLA